MTMTTRELRDKLFQVEEQETLCAVSVRSEGTFAPSDLRKRALAVAAAAVW